MAPKMKVVGDALPPPKRKHRSEVRDGACDFARKHPSQWCMVKEANSGSNASTFAALWNAAVGAQGFEFRAMGKCVYARFTPPKAGK